MTITVRTAQPKKELMTDARNALLESSRATSAKARRMQKVMMTVFGLCAGLMALGTLFLLGYTLVRALPGLSAAFLFQRALPLLWNSLLVAGLSIVIASPYALCAALCNVELYPHARASRLSNRWIELVGCIPTPVLALVLYMLLGTIGMMNWTLYAGAFAGAVFAFPHLYRTIADALGDVPQELRDACRAIGASRLDTAMSVSLPHALSDCVPGLARTVAVLCAEVAIFQALMGNELFAIGGMSEGAQTLSTHVYNAAIEGTKSPEAFASALMLLLLLIGLGQIAQRWSGRWQSGGKERD